MKTIINGKRYDVSYVFNMVGNYYFTDKHGTSYLVDAEDVAVWANDPERDYKTIPTGVTAAIQYAKSLASDTDDGVFWWTEKGNHYAN